MIPVMKPWLGEAEAAAAAEAVASGWVAQGPRVAAFERAVAARLDPTRPDPDAVASGEVVPRVHGVAVSSCTTGLHLALHALGVGPGDEVVVPSLSFIATANAVVHAGATPVFADVDPVTQNLTGKSIEAVVGPRTAAVMVVHQAGIPADLVDVRATCAAHDLPLVEDAACAIGSTHEGTTIGGDAGLAVFSFHPRKIVTTGEGGMVTTTDPELAARLRMLREHGMSVSAAARHAAEHGGGSTPVLEEYLEVAFNYRMTDIQAAVGLEQIAKLDEMIERRRYLASRYRELLADVPGLQLASDPPYGTANFQSFFVVLPDDAPRTRNEVLAGLAEAGVSARRGIMAAHLEPAYAGPDGRPTVTLPETERLTERSLILPLFHTMTLDDQDRVVAALRSLLRA